MKPIKRYAIALIALPLYMIGVVAWMFVLDGIFEESIGISEWSLQDVVIVGFVCAAVLPLSVYLIAATNSDYIPCRARILLITPIPIMTTGLILTPGNMSPISLIAAAICSIGIVVFGLRFWANKPDKMR